MNWTRTYLFLAALLNTWLFISLAQSSFSDGVAAYNKKEYKLAAQNFEKAIDENKQNVAAWYNLGLSNMAQNEYGEAIWNFENVLQLSPSDGETEDKIAYCFNEIHPELEWTPRLNSIESSLYSISLNSWGIICIILSLSCAVGIVFYVQQRKSSLKRVLLFLNVLILVGFIGALLICSEIQSYSARGKYAVITQKSIPTFIEFTASPKTTITEGIRVEVIEKLENDFVKVRTITQETYVVRQKDLRFI